MLVGKCLCLWFVLFHVLVTIGMPQWWWRPPPQVTLGFLFSLVNYTCNYYLPDDGVGTETTPVDLEGVGIEGLIELPFEYCCWHVNDMVAMQCTIRTRNPATSVFASYT